jgi:putative hydrolase of the HAD superfamily
VKVRAILLDLDDTLIDHAGAVSTALRRWLPGLDDALLAAWTDIQEPLPALDDALLTAWTDIQERHLADWRARRISFPEQRRRRLRDFLPLLDLPVPADPDTLDRIFDGYLREYEQAWRAFDDVDGALESLAAAGLATAVLTNGTTEQQNDKLARVGLAGRVGPVFTAEDLGCAKPDAGAFLGACSRWSVSQSLSPGAVVSVGDRYDLDVVAARAAGLQAIHLDRDGTATEAEPRRIRSLTELVDRLER